ncbi:hypothetical protein RB195_010345 [Necator americanus]|uniref:Uncharacterized protein n=1 Tax=Necator americanus TaxID=51031 RepID=A0ABR1CYN6_NECAM
MKTNFLQSYCYIKDEVSGVNQSAGMRRHVHFNSESFEVYERVTSLYNDLRGPADDQGSSEPSTVWLQRTSSRLRHCVTVCVLAKIIGLQIF